MTRVLAAAAVAALALALAGVAHAERIRFGSSLKASANRIEADPVDSVFWARRLANGNRVRSPAKGRVTTVKIKGTAVKRGGKKPLNLFHLQVLHPIKGPKVRVSLTSSNFYLPVGGNRNRISAYHPVNLCVKKGDYVGFSDVGGYDPPQYPNGTPFRIFSNVTGSTMNAFTKAGGDNNGDSFKGTRHHGQELLLRAVVVTGKKAGPYCNR